MGQSLINRVQSYEVLETRLEPIGVAESLVAASAALPDGAYTTLRTYRGRRVVELGRHVHRLVESAALSGTPTSLAENLVRQAIAETLRRAGHPESRLRLTYSLAPPRLFVSVEAFKPLPESLYREGARCATLHMHRANPAAKDTRFIARAAAARAGLPPGSEEGLMVDEDGAILEGLSSNFFALQDGVLHAGGDRVLHGTTRELVLEAATGVIPVAPDSAYLADLEKLTECFLTSVSRGVLPVVHIDDTPIGTGRPGLVTGRIAERYAELVEREASDVLV